MELEKNKADKMFEELENASADFKFESLGFEKKYLKTIPEDDNSIYGISYINWCNGAYIDFLFKFKEICVGCEDESPVRYGYKTFLAIQKAINEKCIELGWV